MSAEDLGEEELPVLPRHTKVVITGNNRTRSVLIGLHGVVKKSVGPGGWHWLDLTNGDEVKLQRNALSVIEAPTGYEDENDGEIVEFSSTSGSDFVSSSSPGRKLAINLRSLETAALRRYGRHFKLEEMNDPAYSKEQLIQAIEKHFISLQLDEFQVIEGFLRAPNRLKRSRRNFTV